MVKVNTQGHTNVSWMIADVEATYFPEAFFDRILCSSGVMYLQYPERTLGQMLAWLKPGGTLHFNINQEDCVRATTCFHKLVHERFGLALADWSAPLGNTRRATAVLQRCGYDDVAVRAAEDVGAGLCTQRGLTACPSARSATQPHTARGASLRTSSMQERAGQTAQASYATCS